MYAEFYGLATRPFQLTPDARFFFESSVHRQAMAYLVYGLHHAEGFIIITGEVGAGKTILVDNLLATINESSFVTAKIVTSQLGGDDLLQMVAGGFGIAKEGLAKGSVLQRINDFVLAQHCVGKRFACCQTSLQTRPWRCRAFCWASRSFVRSWGAPDSNNCASG